MTDTSLESRFTVTRQHRWPDGILIVEITSGGIDYTNPDALAQEFNGEFETFTGLGEAVKTAIEIAEKWKKKTGKTGREIRMAIGNTMGMTAHFDDMPANIKTYRALKKQAAEYDEKLDRCAHCNEILGEERYKNNTSEWSGEEFCREYCAEEAQRHDDEENLKADIECWDELIDSHKLDILERQSGVDMDSFVSDHPEFEKMLDDGADHDTLLDYVENN